MHQQGRSRKIVVALVVAAFLCNQNTHAETQLLDDFGKFSDGLVRILAANSKEASAIKTAMSPVRAIGGQYLKVGLPSSMVPMKTLEALENNSKTLNSIGVSAPMPMGTFEKIRSIALAGKTGTPSSNPEQLARLSAAGSKREAQIKYIRARRAELVNSVAEMKLAADSAQSIGEELGRLVDKPEMEVIARMNGRSFVMSVIDYTQTVVPALYKRVESGEGAINRLDKIITDMEADLLYYKQCGAIIDWLYGDVTTHAGPHAPSPGSEQVSEVARLTQQLGRAMEDANMAAQTLRDQSKAISDRNASIDALSSLLSLGSSTVSLGSSLSGTGIVDSKGSVAKGLKTTGGILKRIRLTVDRRAWVEVKTTGNSTNSSDPGVPLGPKP